jgi:hypothetical protein
MIVERGKKVVIRNNRGEDVDVGIIEEIVEEFNTIPKVRVKTSTGVQTVAENLIVEHLED